MHFVSNTAGGGPISSSISETSNNNYSIISTADMPKATALPAICIVTSPREHYDGLQGLGILVQVCTLVHTYILHRYVCTCALLCVCVLVYYIGMSTEHTLLIEVD